MTDRPITFPRTAPGVWTNRETGVRIIKVVRGKGWYTPSTGVGYWPMTVNRHGGSVPITDRPCVTLTAARIVAADCVTHVVRAAIANAYAEAAEENIDRAGRALDWSDRPASEFGADVLRHFGNARDARRRGDLTAAVEWVRVTEQAIRDRIAADHALALIENAKRDVTEDRATEQEWSFVKRMQRAAQSARSNGTPLSTPQIRQAIIDADHAEALRMGACIIPAVRYPEGTGEHTAYRAELAVELDKWSKGEPPYEYDRDAINRVP